MEGAIPMKVIYFSNFVDEAKIEVNPINQLEEKGVVHRFYITIPFKNRNNGGHVYVFMKNPSNAGKIDESNKKISDDTLYKVLDFINKHENNFRKVTILNLFTVVNGTSSNIREYIESDDEIAFRKQNDEVIIKKLDHFNENKDMILAAWGSYNGLLESKYKRRIREVINIIGKRPIHVVGSMVENGKYPGHGKCWYDYEEVSPYPSSGIQ